MVDEGVGNRGGYVDPRRPAKRAVDLVMPDPYPVSDPAHKEISPDKLADTSLAQRRSKGVQIAVERARQAPTDPEGRWFGRPKSVQAAVERVEEVAEDPGMKGYKRGGRFFNRMLQSGNQEEAYSKAEKIRGMAAELTGDKKGAEGIQYLLEGLADVVERLHQYPSGGVDAKAISSMRGELVAARSDVASLFNRLEQNEKTYQKIIEGMVRVEGLVGTARGEEIRTDIRFLRTSVESGRRESAEMIEYIERNFQNVGEAVKALAGTFAGRVNELQEETRNNYSQAVTYTTRAMLDEIGRRFSREEMMRLIHEGFLFADSEGLNVARLYHQPLPEFGGKEAVTAVVAGKAEKKVEGVQGIVTVLIELNKTLKEVKQEMAGVNKSTNTVQEYIADVGKETYKQTAVRVKRIEDVVAGRVGKSYQDILKELEVVRTELKGIRKQAEERAAMEYSLTPSDLKAIGGMYVRVLDLLPDKFYTKIADRMDQSIRAGLGDAVEVLVNGLKLSPEEKQEILTAIQGVGSNVDALGMEIGHVGRSVGEIGNEVSRNLAQMREAGATDRQIMIRVMESVDGKLSGLGEVQLNQKDRDALARAIVGELTEKLHLEDLVTEDRVRELVEEGVVSEADIRRIAVEEAGRLVGTSINSLDQKMKPMIEDVANRAAAKVAAERPVVQAPIIAPVPDKPKREPPKHKPRSEKPPAPPKPEKPKGKTTETTLVRKAGDRLDLDALIEKAMGEGK